MKVRTRSAVEAGVADCGHFVAARHAVVRRGKRWVCTRCSLPGGERPGEWDPARCAACNMRMGPGARIVLRPDGKWCHSECHDGRPLALATVTEGYSTAF